MVDALLSVTADGVYCAAGDFFVDPWRPVARAVITHAHSDHARPGSGAYLAAARGEGLLRHRLGTAAAIETLDYGEAKRVGGARVSLHPAGHMLGSAQVRIEAEGEVWVVSGDYKAEADPTCTPFEPVPCDLFITETTFGLPIYRWPAQHEVFEAINGWWRGNASAGRASLLLAYSAGKAQRILAGIDPSIGPIFTHGAVEPFNRLYRAKGIDLPDTRPATPARGGSWGGALIIAPPSAAGTPWVRRFGDAGVSFASGWMRIRGARRRRGVERGFVLSDHVDWPGLLQAIEATGAGRIRTTHGYAEQTARWLKENGYEAEAIETRFVGERDDALGADD